MATAREVLKHFSVEVCVMVDLDKVSLYTHICYVAQHTVYTLAEL
jgi:spermidine synthase